MHINAFGKQCPEPLVLAKKEIDAGLREFSISVDNDTAVKNLTRLGAKCALHVEVTPVEGGSQIFFSEGDAPQEQPVATARAVTSADSAAQVGSGYAVFIGKDHIGEGDETLGYNLMKMALYTLAESSDVPASLLFMNSGVKLVTGDEEQIVESLNTLIEKGTEVLVCGSCLDYYHLTEELNVGEISNMYDIIERMQEARKVISW